MPFYVALGFLLAYRLVQRHVADHRAKYNPIRINGPLKGNYMYPSVDVD